MNSENKVKFLTFWAINGELQLSKLKKQLAEMQHLGFEGTVFHPRYYPGVPKYLSAAYMSILSDLILYAKEIGMEIWLYDENGWPSGRADGQVMASLGGCRCQYLVFEDNEVLTKERHTVNSFSPEAVTRFIEITHEGYRKGLHPDAFAYLKGFFADEVGFLDGHSVSMQEGGVPWHADLAKLYYERYEEDLEEHLEELFLAKGEYRRTRIRFWDTAALLLGSNFYKQINQWCNLHGKRFTCHLKGEENLFFQIPTNGAAQRALIEVNTPGVDALERFPGNHYFPRIASSLSRQFGDGLSMAEVLGGSGWGLSPRNLEQYIDWLAGCGITLFIFHISQYNFNSSAVQDWPPNIPFGMNWQKCFPQLLSGLHAKWDGFAQQRQPILLVTPTRGVMAEYNPKEAMLINEHNGAGTPDTPSGRISKFFAVIANTLANRGIDFDVAEEWLIEEYGKVLGNTFQLGRQTYKKVIFNKDCLWSESSFAGKLIEVEVGLQAESLIWRVKAAGENQLLLENNKERIPFHCINCAGLSIFAMEQLPELFVMGQKLQSESCEEGYRYNIPESLIADAKTQKYLEIRYTRPPNLKAAFVYLRGNFLVKGLGAWEEQDARQLKFTGEFCLEDMDYTAVNCSDLIRSGFPYMQNQIQVECETYIDDCAKLNLLNIRADAFSLSIDGKNFGDFWEEEITLVGIPEGIHRIALALIPSTFNRFGPHHHYQGDRHLISPDQYLGKRNFAEDPDAPDCTLDEKWRFVKFGLES